ncbi:hypothetical protein [Streptomyces sp. W4I9-2]|uniref:hypothetical protein n=1 Tax=Streptomyces sp. W4I9-2 TaxID=3042297 RepID=UPI002783CF0A|nr:hypothetical protein [Streptomyces sp. W4I9-2]MDQ0694237.1 hypothetical protein [Streptomyces sp. W4I9-2]
MADRTYAWRITERDQGRTLLAAGFTSFDTPLVEWDAAPVIVDQFREEHPDAGTVTIDLWLKEDWLPADLPPAWESDRDPHGTDPVPCDAAGYSYDPTVDEDPDDRARADNLAAALKGHDEAVGRVAVETAENAVAALNSQ